MFIMTLNSIEIKHDEHADCILYGPHAGKKYGVLDFIACLMMSGGLIFFTLADSSVSPTFSVYGKLRYNIKMDFIFSNFVSINNLSYTVMIYDFLCLVLV